MVYKESMRREYLVRVCILALLTLGVSAMHYFTPTEREALHDIYRRLYYIPIVLGGMWFHLRGGVALAVLVSILYLPHIFLHWGHQPGRRLEQYLEIILYNLIGIMTGFLAQREHRQRQLAEVAVDRLEESYEKLRDQADQILDIEEQLRRADRLTALGELSAGMAHEIRNPLGSIRGTAEILQDGFSPGDKRYEFARILIQEVERLNGVVQDFLTFSRPEPPEVKPFDAPELLREVVQLLQQQARKQDVSIAVAAEQVSSLCGHREQIKQVFLNLALNALQAMPAGGELHITATQDGDFVVIRFQDTGPGISEEARDRIFNPFFTTRSEGTGLGLAITQRIVSAHKGRIEIEETSAQGTVFALTLPCSKECIERYDD